MRLQVSSEAAGSGKARPGWLFALVLGAVLGASLGGCSALGGNADAPARADAAAKEKDRSPRGGATPTVTGQASESPDEVAVRGRGGPVQGTYRPEGLPNIALTPPLLLKILAAEIGLQRQQLSTSYATYQDLAVRTRDARLARRATEIALAGRAFEQALASAKLWSELDPASTESQQTVETLQLATGKLKDVEPALTRRLATAREQGKLEDTYLQLQRTLTRIQDRKEGWALLQRISQPDLDVVAARMARASVAAAADQKEAAATEALAAAELAPKDASAAIAAAQYTQELPDGGPRAASQLEGFLRRSPDNQMVGLALGRLYLSEDQFDKARATLERVLQQDPENPQVLYSLAQASYQAKDVAAAQGYLKRYVELPESFTRENAPAYLFLSQIAEENNRTAEAITWLEQIQGGDLYISAVSRRAQLTAREGDFDKARQLIKDTTPRNQRERLALISAEAQVLREAKRYQDAFDLLNAAVAKDPNAPDLLYDHAMAAERIDDIAVMEKSLRKLMELRPDSAHAYNALGYTLADRNQRLPEALELIKKAIALMPDDPQIIDSLGWVYYRLGDMEKALQFLREAYAAKPDVEVAAHLGEVLWTTGARDEAMKVWREASGREPKNEVLRGTLARLNVSL
ncbi:MAG: tetratricopeptide repeat protein [Burkholderiaceae bacterium]|nr:tetratricopeptide repeat protein [Burkholderiaceae bacterium]